MRGLPFDRVYCGSPIHATKRLMKPEIKKNIFGKYDIKFDCPSCSSRLTSPLTEAGELDFCPSCGVKFRVPGKAQREIYEARVQRELAAKAAEKKRREEEQLAAAAEAERRREEQRAAQALIERREAEERHQNELTNLSLPQPQVLGRMSDAHHDIVLGADQAECPFCAEVIALRAKKCKHCGELLDPVLRATEERRRAVEAPQIVNIVHGSTATANSTSAAEASSASAHGCGGCLATIILMILIAACAGAFG